MLPVGFTAGPPPSTKMPSSSLPGLATGFFAGVATSSSSSFMNPDWIDARRFSHHSLSEGTFAWIWSSFFLKAVLAAISLADWNIELPQPSVSAFAYCLLATFKKIGGGEHTSWTTSLSSSSMSRSARVNLSLRSSPTLPRCNNVVHACFALLICIIRWISSTARRKRAARRTLSGTLTGFSLPGSRCSKERYISLDKCCGNHGASVAEAAFLCQDSGLLGLWNTHWLSAFCKEKRMWSKSRRGQRHMLEGELVPTSWFRTFWPIRRRVPRYLVLNSLRAQNVES